MHTKTQTDTLVLGLGNLLFYDEGLGIYAMHSLQNNFHFTPMPDFLDGGTLGMNLLDYYHRYRRILILDSLSLEQGKPAEVYQLPAQALHGMGHTRKTAHEIEVLQTLDFAQLLNLQVDIQLVLMTPEDISRIEFGLSAPVQQAMPQMITQALNVLQAWKITAVANASRLNTYDVIQSVIPGEH